MGPPLFSLREYEQFRRLLAQRQLIDLGQKVGAEASRQGLTEQQLQDELAATRKAVFREKYGDPA